MRLFPILAFIMLCCAGCASLDTKPYPFGGRLPDGYAEHPTEQFPLILFLHGAGDTTPQENIIPEYAATQPGFPFIVIAPRAKHDWSVTRLDALLRELQLRYRIDPQRIYLTGLSMGAFGSWNMASAYPDRFAAVAMMAGGGDPARACDLKKVPIWLIHNRADAIVRVSRSEQLASALQACQGNVRLTINETLKSGQFSHDAWSDVYLNPELYRWFLEQHKGP